jgi:dTMP kinase
MAADRTLHVEELLKPTLASGRHVICDRYTHSTIAYQGYGRGLNLTDVTEIARIAESGLRPDLTLVIHVSAEVCAARLSSRGEKNRLEEVDEGFSTRVREAYLEQAGADGSIVVIDGSGSVAEVHEAIMSVLHTRLGLVGL